MAEPAASSEAHIEDPERLPIARQELLGKAAGPLARLEYGALRASLEILSRLPPRVQRVVVDVVARAAFHVICRRRTRLGLRFARQALGPEASEREVARTVLGAWRHMFFVAIELPAFVRLFRKGAVLDRFHMKVHEDMDELLRHPEGLLIVSPHLGNWEVAAPPVYSLGFSSIYVIAKAPRNRFLSIYLQRLREATGARLLPRQGAMKSVRSVLSHGGCVFLLPDQRARKRAVLAPFFGALAPCDRSVGTLIQRMGVPVLFLSCLRAGKPLTYNLELTRLLAPEELRELSPVEIASRINREMEHMILEQPDQYLWFHDRYRRASKEPST